MKSHEIEDIYPLSPMQEGLLFQSLYAPNSRAYCEQFSFHLSGSLNIKAFVNSWKLLSRRHAILRTAFAHKNHPRPLQVVFKERDIPVAVETLDDLPETVQQQRIEEYLEHDREKGFDLTFDPLMRIMIFRLGENSNQVVWSHHHILTDGWCIGIFFRELIKFYKNFCIGKTPDLSAPIPYREYIRWLEEQNQDEAKTYWQNYLTEYNQLVSLPVYGSGYEGSDYNLAELLFTLDKEISDGLRSLAICQNVTLSTIIRFVWGILLSRYNGTEDVIFGAIVSGRPSEIKGINEMIGLFINAIPVRIRFHAKYNFSEFIRIIQEDSLTGEKYHHVSLAEIQAECSQIREIFDHLLVFENYPMNQELIQLNIEKDTEFSIDHVEIYEQTHYNFNLLVFPTENIRIKFSYNKSLYPEHQMEQVAEHLKTVIRSILENPEKQIGEINILPEQEKRRVLYEFNDTAAEYPKDKTIMELFEEQVERMPSNIAVVF